VPLTVTTDHETIAALLDGYLAADPVRATLLGTIRASLAETAWAAYHDGGIAVRSEADYPVSVYGEWPAARCAELSELFGALPGLRGVSGEQGVVAGLAGDRVGRRMAQRLFRLDALVPPDGVPGSAVFAGPAERDLVRAWCYTFLVEAEGVWISESAARRIADRAVDGGHCFLWSGGTELVSMAARRPVIAGSARVGPVYTPPEHRGRGYGSAVTAAATRSILDDGAVPVLFTDLANPTSNKIYQQLGYRPVEDRLIVTFE
jgi:Predicted acetyltransferase